jgi:hypothetical protein
MTFPAVQQVVENSTNTAGTSHVINLPTATAGQLLLIILDKGSTSATINAHGSLTELLDEASANGLYIAYRQMDGSEPSSYTLTSSANTRTASHAYRISGAANPSVQPPVIGTTGTGTSATPDPPASATPSGTKDFLFIAFAGMAGEEADDDTWGNTPPTNYTPSPPRQKTCGTAGTSLGGLILAAERQLNTGSAENPGTFGVDTSAAWRSQTIIVYPDENIRDAGAIGTEEAFGTAALHLTVSGAGAIASEEAFGTASVNLTINDAGGIASAEVIGDHTISEEAPSGDTLVAEGIASAEEFGAASVHMTVTAVGNIASAEAFGTATVFADLFITDAGGIASAEEVGAATLLIDVTITNAGAIESAETFGAATIFEAGGPLTITSAGAIASEEAFGAAEVELSIAGAGNISSEEAFGAATLEFTIVGVGAIASAEAFGIHTLTGGFVVVVGPGHVGASDSGAHSVGFSDRAAGAGASDQYGATVGAGDAT